MTLSRREFLQKTVHAACIPTFQYSCFREGNRMANQSSIRAETRAFNVRHRAASGKWCSLGICEDLRLNGRGIRLDGKSSSLYAVIGNSKAITSALPDRLEYLRTNLNDCPVKRVLENTRLLSALHDVVGQLSGYDQPMVVTLADIKTAGKFLGEELLGSQHIRSPRMTDCGSLLGASCSLELSPGMGHAVRVNPSEWQFGYHVEEKQLRKRHNYRLTSHHISFGNHFGNRCLSLARTGEAFSNDHHLGRRPIELSRPQREGTQLRYYDCAQVTVRVFDYSTLNSGAWDPETRHWAAAIDTYRDDCETIVMSGFSCRMSANIGQTLGVDQAIDDALCGR